MTMNGGLVRLATHEYSIPFGDVAFSWFTPRSARALIRVHGGDQQLDQVAGDLLLPCHQ